MLEKWDKKGEKREQKYVVFQKFRHPSWYRENLTAVGSYTAKGSKAARLGIDNRRLWKVFEASAL